MTASLLKGDMTKAGPDLTIPTPASKTIELGMLILIKRRKIK
jgi:hypothetical protein